MKLKEAAVKTLNELPLLELIQVQEYMQTIKGKSNGNGTSRKECKQAYKKVRSALKGCKGLLSSDIISQREDRV
ncbi:MAG: hypothetical protein PHQ23_15855 [Candidatus Wallbacteria bacterium]|nr:hypothetical protein [Candidatus Wallbacteria bacterium]